MWPQKIVSKNVSVCGRVMSGGLAHEINTPLGAILLRANQVTRLIDRIISENVEPNLNQQKIREMSISIVDTANRISKIITGLRKFSRTSSDEPIKAVKISSIVADALNLCQTRFSDYGIDIEVQGDQAIELICDEIPISQVFLNLLNNSFDAIISSSEKWIKIIWDENDYTIVLKFIDSGGGISKEVRDKLLTPFFTTKPVGQGTGLGLSISVGIVRSYGGTLEIDHTNKNTCFVVTFAKNRQEDR